MKKTVVFLLSLLVFAVPSHAASAPEIFVQTGHAGGVNFVALNPGGTHLVTMEDSLSYGRFVKIWDTATGREIRTVKLETEYSITNVYFMNDSRFIVFYRKVAEIFDLYGQKLETITLPKVINVSGPAISEDRQYFFNQEFGTRVYNIKDGSEIFVPEVLKYKDFQRYNQWLADLDNGYYGVFHIGETRKGNVDYVIYDDCLNIALKGSLNIPGISFNCKFKVSADLKYVAYQPLEMSADVLVFSLESGEQILRYRPRPLYQSNSAIVASETFYFGFTPDGRLRVEYDLQKKDKQTLSARVEMSLVSPAKNGILSEKKLPVIETITWIAYPYHCRPYILTDKGMFAGMADGNVKLLDINTEEEIKSFGVKPAAFNNAYALGNRIFNWYEEWSTIDKKISLTFNLWDLDDAAPLKKVNVKTETALRERPVTIGKYRSTSWFSSDPDALVRHVPRDFLKENYRKEESYGQISGGMFHILRAGGNFLVAPEQHKLVLKSTQTKKRLVDLYGFEDGEWIIMTPDGYYMASPNGDRYLGVRKDNNIYSIENYREAFFRPDLVKLALAGNSLEGYRTLADTGKPPVVKIEGMPDRTKSDSVTFTLRITDTGGGIGDIRLYLNDTSIMTDSARAVIIKGKARTKENEIVKKYTLQLLNGANTIKAIAFDKENNVQSNPAVQKITSSFTRPKKPSLYALVIGINDYKNPKLKLKYAAADAQLFAEVLRETAGRIFDKVNITTLTTRNSSSKTNILRELEKYKALNPDDVFAFYVASHGTVDDGEYYLITSNVGALSTEKLKKDAVTQKELRERIANVPAAKKLIIIDTCNAGKLGEQLQMAMLTRGMSEDTAMKILSRAVGSTIISASSSLQEALEGYKDHGLFTYVLAEGMKGGADVSRSGYVKTSDLASYVEEKVPEIAEAVFKRAQYPTKAVNGNDFPIGKVR